MLGGGMLANVIGVPLGAFAGQTIGWRGTFWALALLALPAAVIVHRQVTTDPESGPAPSVRAEITSLRDARVWLVLSGCAIVCGSSLAAYSFISPLLTTNGGLVATAVPLVLAGYGVGACIAALYFVPLAFLLRRERSTAASPTAPRRWQRTSEGGQAVGPRGREHRYNR